MTWDTLKDWDEYTMKMVKQAPKDKYTGLQFEMEHPMYVVEYKRGKAVNSTAIDPKVVLKIMVMCLEAGLEKQRLENLAFKEASANAPASPTRPKRPSKSAASGKRPGKIAK